MKRFPLVAIDPFEAFPALAEIPQPPKSLSVRGSLECLKGKKLVAFVGSRKCTSYGTQVCRALIEGLAGYPVVIVSGLALGIDSIAHQCALDASIPTIAFPGSGLSWDTLYPAQHRGLAEAILAAGGALVSEYRSETIAAPWTFPQRNRLMAGVAEMTIVIEAEEKSGTLITARLATEYNKIVGAVPGAITTPSSRGTNWLLKMGAVPITESLDILKELNLKEKSTDDIAELLLLNSDEEKVLRALHTAKTKDALVEELGLEVATANIIFSTLEIKGAIRESYGLLERIV